MDKDVKGTNLDHVRIEVVPGPAIVFCDVSPSVIVITSAATVGHEIYKCVRIAFVYRWA